MDEDRPTFEQVMSAALGFDIEREIGFCRELTAKGGPGTVERVVPPWRAVRLFQALLSTGRYRDMGDQWRKGVESGVERGVLTRPEWN